MNVGLEPSTVYATTIPFVLFAAFQLMFAAITPALITGAFAERKRFASFVLFTDPLVDRRLLADRPLGLGHRRLAVQARRARLRRRHRRPCLVRRVGPDRGPPDRPARRQRRPDGAARHPDDRPRRGPPLVRLVRLQRRLRGGRQRPRGQRLHRHEHGRRRGDPHLGRRELPRPPQGQRRRRRLRRRRRPRRDHARLGLRDAGRRDPDRPRGRRPVLQRDPPPRADQGRRRARRLRCPRCRRHVRRGRDRRARDQRHPGELHAA